MCALAAALGKTPEVARDIDHLAVVGTLAVDYSRIPHRVSPDGKPARPMGKRK